MGKEEKNPPNKLNKQKIREKDRLKYHVTQTSMKKRERDIRLRRHVKSLRKVSHLDITGHHNRDPGLKPSITTSGSQEQQEGAKVLDGRPARNRDVFIQTE